MQTQIAPVPTTTARKQNTYAIYRGPSMIDGKPIIVLASGFRKTANGKTGQMVGTWIIREDVNPFAAKKDGQSKSVCGGCPLQDNGCYVRVEQAPLSLWRAWHRGVVPVLAPDALTDAFAGRPVRLGSYGDPAAVPMAVWDAVLAKATTHTGYTHQWRGKRFADFKRWCMASCDTEVDLEDAKAAGWATYRVRPKGTALLPGEVQCPASAEAGHVADCAACGRCGGLVASDRLKQLQYVSIMAHGAQARRVHIAAARRH